MRGGGSSRVEHSRDEVTRQGGLLLAGGFGLRKRVRAEIVGLHFFFLHSTHEIPYLCNSFLYRIIKPTIYTIKFVLSYKHGPFVIRNVYKCCLIVIVYDLCN